MALHIATDRISARSAPLLIPAGTLLTAPRIRWSCSSLKFMAASISGHHDLPLFFRLPLAIFFTVWSPSRFENHRKHDSSETLSPQCDHVGRPSAHNAFNLTRPSVECIALLSGEVMPLIDADNATKTAGGVIQDFLDYWKLHFYAGHSRCSGAPQVMDAPWGNLFPLLCCGLVHEHVQL